MHVKWAMITFCLPCSLSRMRPLPCVALDRACAASARFWWGAWARRAGMGPHTIKDPMAGKGTPYRPGEGKVKQGTIMQSQQCNASQIRPKNCSCYGRQQDGLAEPQVLINTVEDYRVVPWRASTSGQVPILKAGQETNDGPKGKPMGVFQRSTFVQ